MKPHEVESEERVKMFPLVVALSALFGCVIGAVVFAPLLAKVLQP